MAVAAVLAMQELECHTAKIIKITKNILLKIWRKKMTNLLKLYPDLIEKCRLWDCSFSEAISKIESQKQKEGLLKYCEPLDEM